MRKNNIIIIFFLFLFTNSFFSCLKDGTVYYNDPENPGLGIFSSTGNNLMTCFIQNKPWRTIDRFYASGWSFQNNAYEVFVNRQITNNIYDTLSFTWLGYYNLDSSYINIVSLVLPVQKNLNYGQLSAALNGQRISLDSLNGYFTFNSSITNYNTVKGTGDIYFHNFQLDTALLNGGYTGSLNGLFDAKFDTLVLSQGRFDHALESVQISL